MPEQPASCPSPTPHVLLVGPCSECSGPTDEFPNGYRCDRSYGTWPGQEHSYAYEVKCPGTDAGQCQAWQSCQHTNCPIVSGDQDGYADEDAHGEEHQSLNGEWMTRNLHESCWIADNESLDEAVSYLPGIRLGGRYEVYGDDQDGLVLELVTASGSAG